MIDFSKRPAVVRNNHRRSGAAPCPVDKPTQPDPRGAGLKGLTASADQLRMPKNGAESDSLVGAVSLMRARRVMIDFVRKA